MSRLAVFRVLSAPETTAPLGSLLPKVLEVVSGLLLAGRDVAVLVDVDLALALQLEHQSLGLLEVGCHGVELGQLRLGRLEEVHLRLHVRLLRGVGLLLQLDLLAGATPLAADLQHVGGDALRDCKIYRVSPV